MITYGSLFPFHREDIYKQKEYMRNAGGMQNDDTNQKSTLEKSLAEVCLLILHYSSYHSNSNSHSFLKAEREYAICKERERIEKDELESMELKRLQLKFNLEGISLFGKIIFILFVNRI